MLGRCLERHPAELRLQPLGSGRRLSSVRLQLRVTLVLEANSSADEVLSAQQSLAFLGEEKGRQRLQELLGEELGGGNVTEAATEAFQVLDSYSLVAPRWLLGPWQCIDCLETAELLCSRGSALLCEGPAAVLAGEPPLRQRPCSSCEAHVEMRKGSV